MPGQYPARVSDHGFWAAQSLATEPGPAAAAIDRLPADLGALRAASQQLVFHYWVADPYPLLEVDGTAGGLAFPAGVGPSPPAGHDGPRAEGIKVIPMAALRASASAGADGPVVVLSGEADPTTAAVLREMLAAQLNTGARLVTVDASRLSFLDSASVRVLVLAARALKGRHGRLVLARPQPIVARLLEITGADRLLDVRELAGPGSRTVHSMAFRASGGGDQPGTPALTPVPQELVATIEACFRTTDVSLPEA
jgi:anti-anti-sigma factor